MSGLLPATQIRPPFVFRDGESFNGGVARFAASNWHERMIEVTRAAGLEFGHRPSASAVDTGRLAPLADFMGVDVADLIARARPHKGECYGAGGLRLFDGLALPAYMVESRIRRHAPTSLQLPNGDYHRALWDLRLLPVCTETGQILLDRCQNTICQGGRVSWVITSGIVHCEHCMADLRYSQSSVLMPDLIERLRPVADLYTSARRQHALIRLPAALTVDDGQLASDLLVALLPVVDPGLSRDIQRLHLADPARVCEATALAWNVMEGWPERFLDLARSRMEARTKRNSDGNGGRTTRFLRRPNRGSYPALDALIADVHDSLELAGQSAAVANARYVVINEAAQLLGLGTRQLAGLRRRKGLGTTAALHTGVCTLLFDRAEVQRIRRDISDRMGFDRVSSRFGISHDGISQLVELSLLELLDHPFHHMRYGVHQTTQASFDQLFADLIANQSAISDDESIRLTQAMKAIGGRFKPWGPAFQAFLNGHIAYTIDDGPSQLTQRIRIPAEDARALANLVFDPASKPRILPAAKMSKLDAMEVLNIGSPQVTDLFAHIPTKKGGRHKSVAVVEVLTIARQCISTVELAVRRGVASQKAYADARRSNITNYGPAGFCRATAEAAFEL